MAAHSPVTSVAPGNKAPRAVPQQYDEATTKQDADGLAILQPNDSVRSVHAGRVGVVVRSYSDGSAAVRWNDGKPLADGLAHERMPLRLLELVQPELDASATKKDEFGFAETVRGILPDRLGDTANGVWDGCRRSAALLRTLHYQLLNDAQHCEQNIHDVEALVEMALKALPDTEGELFDALDMFSINADRAVRNLLNREQALTALLDATEVAAHPEATRDEINQAASKMYDNAMLAPNGARHWEAFCAMVRAQGLFIEWSDPLVGLPARPEVHTAQSRQAARKARRKMAAAINAAMALG